MERKKTCQYCKKEFKCPYGVGIGAWSKKKFCSIKCSGKGKENKVGLICQYCHNKFFVYKSWSKVRKRCSKKCESLDKKGKHINPETEIKTGQHLSPQTELKKGNIPWHAGTNNSPMKGVLRPKSFVDLVSGSNNWNWRGGISGENKKIRESRDYVLWRKDVFSRDNWTCQICDKRGVTLNADHIKPFSLYPELRFDRDNGRTLCVECHRKTNTYGARIYKNYDQIT